jgi:16S rRNA G966 N2-methylase RsmD
VSLPYGSGHFSGVISVATSRFHSLTPQVWLLGDHRLEESTYSALMNGRKADVVFTDPPYDVKIDGNVCGKGAIRIANSRWLQVR